MKIENEFRIRCKCGKYIDSKVMAKLIKKNDGNHKFKSDTLDEMMEHMMHMHGGEILNLYSIKLNGEIQAMDYHTVFDMKYIL